MSTAETKTITLDSPIQRGDSQITEIILRKPRAGELRGTNLTDLLQMDVAALIKVIPRISTPTLTEAEVSNLDPADFTQLGGEVASFLLQRAAFAELLSQSA